MNKDISVNCNQKCFILYRKILLEVLHNMNLTVLLPWLRLWRNQSSQLHILHVFQTSICPEPMQIFQGILCNKPKNSRGKL